jgi:hypothetical protein
MRGDKGCDYLQDIRNQITTGDRIFMFCDMQASHLIRRVKSVEVKLNVKLLYVPGGAIDQFHPLDKMIVWILKSESRRLFCHRTSDDTELKRSKPDAITNMIEA